MSTPELDYELIARSIHTSPGRYEKRFAIDTLYGVIQKLHAELAATKALLKPLPSITDDITATEAEASAAFNLTIDEIRALLNERDAARAELEQLHAWIAQHAPGPQLHIHRDPNGTDTHGDLGWCRHLAATCGGEVMTAYVCGYRSPWRPVACRSCGTTERVLGDPPLCTNCVNYGTTTEPRGVIGVTRAPGAMQTAPQPDNGHGEGSNSSASPEEPTGPAPCHVRHVHDGLHHACIRTADHNGDHRCTEGDWWNLADDITADADQPEIRDQSAWCWTPNPNGPLPCGRLAGHAGPHQRGERRWDNTATQEAET